MIPKHVKKMIRNHLSNELHGLQRQPRRQSRQRFDYEEPLELPSTESNDSLLNNCACQDDDEDDEVLSLPGSTLTNRIRTNRKSKKVDNAYDFDDDENVLDLPSTQRQRSRD